MTTIELMNRLSSKTIGMRYLTEILEKVFLRMNVTSGFEPRVFGCISHLYSSKMQRNKLLARAQGVGVWVTKIPKRVIGAIILYYRSPSLY